MVLTSACFADVFTDLKADFIAGFNDSIRIDYPAGTKIQYVSGKMIHDGISGKALSLSNNQYLALTGGKFIGRDEGSISLWVRPHPSSEASASRTFVSFQWLEPSNSYFVLSQGWWEKHGGAGMTYFVANNAEPTHLTRDIMYPPGKWIHLAVVWKAGDNAFTKLYVDGFAVAHRDAARQKKPIRPGLKPADVIYIGCDFGTGDMRDNRFARSDIDELAIFKRALTDEEVLVLYEAAGKPSYEPYRDKDGVVLQSRVISDEGRGWMTAEGAASTIARIKKAGFNVYMPCVWHGQGTRYPSEAAVAEPGRIFRVDPLKRLIDLAHAEGIEVHPIFTIALRQRDFYKKYYDDGTPKNAFNVHHPEFRKFIADLVIDAVQRYDLDGVNLDYIRTMGLCDSPYCQEDYFKKYGRNLLDDAAQRRGDKAMSSHVLQWQAQAVESIVRDIASRAKAIRPGIIISVDGRPELKPSEEGREDLSWANTDLVDVVFNMDYRYNPDFEHLKLMSTKFKEPRKLLQLVGNYDAQGKKVIAPRNADRVARLISHSLNRMPHGVGIYDYAYLTDEQIQTIADGPFRQAARPFWKK